MTKCMSINHDIGVGTNIDSNTLNYNSLFRISENRDTYDQIIRRLGQRETFWQKHRNLLFLVAGLVLGCIVTVFISIAFFFLEWNKGHGNCQSYGKKFENNHFEVVLILER